MKVVCIDAPNSPVSVLGGKKYLTNGKVYDVLYFDDYLNLYTILDDMSYIEKFSGDRFVTLSDFRNDKLKELGI